MVIAARNGVKHFSRRNLLGPERGHSCRSEPQSAEKRLRTLTPLLPSVGRGQECPHSGPALFDKFQLLPMRNQTALVGLTQETANGFPAPLAVIEGPMVDVHADELVDQVPAHVPRIFESVLDRLRPMVKAVLNAGAENLRDDLANIRFETFVNHVASKGERQSVVLSSKPHAQVFANLKPFLLIGELPLVDDQANVSVSRADSFKNPVE